MKPSELSITLAAVSAALNHRYSSEGWVCADEVRGYLKLLGCEVKTQQVAAWLGRMSRVDAPWVERRESRWGGLEYRVTQYGKTDLDNRLHLHLRLPWLPVYRGALA